MGAWLIDAMPAERIVPRTGASVQRVPATRLSQSVIYKIKGRTHYIFASCLFTLKCLLPLQQLAMQQILPRQIERRQVVYHRYSHRGLHPLPSVCPIQSPLTNPFIRSQIRWRYFPCKMLREDRRRAIR